MRHYKKNELQRWYNKFMKQFPDKQMDKIQFHQLYGELFPSDVILANNIFKSFDHDGNGSISFKELMITFSLTTVGSEEEKLKWLFSVYDRDRNGKITQDEVRHIAHLMMKTSHGSEHSEHYCPVDHTEDDDEDEDHISCIFHNIDADQNGYWTLDEFVEGISSHPELVKILHTDLRNTVV